VVVGGKPGPATALWEVCVAAPTVEPQDEYLGEHHVYTPHRVGLPPLGVYVQELWRRRQFVDELARSELRSQNFDTVFGQLWLILSPLLNGFVYFLLVDILRGGKRPPEYLAHLLGGIFAWTFVSGSISSSATAVTSGGRLILNTAFPRLLLPITDVVVAFFRFLPTLPVLAIVILVTIPGKVTLAVLLAVPVFLLIMLTSAGCAFIAATLQVYFRDFNHLLPYLLRLGLYLTPILYFAEDAKGSTRLVTLLNPLSPVFRLWSDVIVRGTVPGWHVWAQATIVAVVVFTAGTLYYISRERDFAVRI
jgi:ABC-type polysaccharide/polyol phosphate export permease